MKRLFTTALILLVILLAGDMMAQPSPPTLLTPINGATGVSLFPTFDWSDVTGATSYRLQVVQGATTVLDQAGILTSQYTVVTAILAANTPYYWRVNATGGSGTSNWTGYFTFTTGDAPPATPTLVAPTTGATNVSLTPLLDWNNSTGATSYRVQASTSNTFSTTVIDVPGIVNSGYVVQTGALANGTLYYWRVNASNTAGSSGWSDVWNFTTIPAAPPAPTLIFPANNAINVTLTPTMDWSDAATATGYHIQISQNNTFANIVFEDNTLTASQVAIPAGTLSGQTQYYWRVQSSNAGGSSSWSSVFTFTTMVGAPSAPILVSPPNGSTGQPLVLTLDWNDVPNNQTYRVQVSTNSSFTTTVVNMLTGGTSNYGIPNGALAYNTLYYWRVNSTNTGGTSPWSNVWTFQTNVAPPAAPTLVSPTNNSTGIVLAPLMDWNDVVSTNYYRIQISTSQLFTTSVIDVTNITNSQYQVISGVLTGNTLYYWRVSATNAGGTSAWSTVWNFRTQNSFYLNLKVYLEGFYNVTYHVQDTIKVYLANTTTPYALRDSATIFLGSDGTANAVSFAKATNGNYYLIVKHRNHIETWSSTTPAFSTGSTVIYDFTTAATKAYGSNMKQVGTVWVLYGGDGNADGFVNPSDYDLYRTQFGLDGYRACDFNGDGYVDGNDLPIIYSNFGKSLQRPY